MQIDKLLLIIPDDSLRQLYHEILFSVQTEIVPVSSLAAAILLLTIENFTAAILWAEEDLDTEIFLHLREKSPRLGRVKLVLLSEDFEFADVLAKTDILLSPSHLNIHDIATKIKEFSTIKG